MESLISSLIIDSAASWFFSTLSKSERRAQRIRAATPWFSLEKVRSLVWMVRFRNLTTSPSADLNSVKYRT